MTDNTYFKHTLNRLLSDKNVFWEITTVTETVTLQLVKKLRVKKYEEANCADTLRNPDYLYSWVIHFFHI